MASVRVPETDRLLESVWDRGGLGTAPMTDRMQRTCDGSCNSFCDDSCAGLVV